MHLVLISCCGPKAAHPCLAANMYLSPLFQASRHWAERYGDRWAILSAKLGVVHPDTLIAPYDWTFSRMSAAARREWDRQVLTQLAPYRHDTLTVLAGRDYCRWCWPGVNLPLRGLPGIGRRIAWLNQY